MAKKAPMSTSTICALRASGALNAGHAVGHGLGPGQRHRA